jgi:RimJ/RimL family protein N-acetyltransferase
MSMEQEQEGRPVFAIRRLSDLDAGSYRDLRLAALRSNPEAFRADLEDEAGQALDWFGERLRSTIMFGAWMGNRLIGTAGLRIPEAVKLRHKGIVWAVFVQPDARGTGAASALIDRVVADARDHVEELLLTVMASNRPAIRLYERVGFQPYGIERRALKIGGEYFDELLMALPLVPRHPAQSS